MRVIVALLLASVLAAQAGASEVIVNAALSQDKVSRSLLRGIFGMRVRIWPDGTPVEVFVLDKDAPSHIDFCRQQLRMYPYQLEDSWSRLVYSGTGQSPTRVASLQEMRQRVAASPGAIGYLDQATIAESSEQIRILHVE